MMNLSLYNSSVNIKIVYTAQYYNFSAGKIEHIPNGHHPVLEQYILDRLNANRSTTYHDILNEISEQNDDSNWKSHIVHSNFYYYYNKHFNKNNIILESEIIDDGSIYIYPIEFCYTPDTILNQYKLTLNNVSYEYEFIDTISSHLLNLLRAGKVKLLLDTIHDPTETSTNLILIEQYFQKHGISPRNIIYVSGNNYQDYYKEYPSSELKISSGFIVLDQIFDRIAEYPNVGSLGYKSDYVRKDNLDYNTIRPKKFICLNRNMHRPHRWLSAYLAAKYDLIDNSIFSFVSLHNSTEQRINGHLNYYGNEDNELAQKIWQFVPREIDTHHLDNNQKSGFQLNNNNKDLYLSTYVNIVNETSFDKGDSTYPFISEKTFHHPIINLQPFIVIGNPFTIKTLHELGFKTFHPLIDESYDSCVDFKQRLLLIEKQIERLSKITQKELHDIYYKLTDIVIHNQTHAITLKDYNPFGQVFNDIRKWYTNGFNR